MPGKRHLPYQETKDAAATALQLPGRSALRDSGGNSLPTIRSAAPRTRPEEPRDEEAGHWLQAAEVQVRERPQGAQPQALPKHRDPLNSWAEMSGNLWCLHDLIFFFNNSSIFWPLLFQSSPSRCLRGRLPGLKSSESPLNKALGYDFFSVDTHVISPQNVHLYLSESWVRPPHSLYAAPTDLRHTHSPGSESWGCRWSVHSTNPRPTAPGLQADHRPITSADAIPCRPSHRGSPVC